MVDNNHFLQIDRDLGNFAGFISDNPTVDCIVMKMDVRSCCMEKSLIDLIVGSDRLQKNCFSAIMLDELEDDPQVIQRYTQTSQSAHL